MICEKIFFENSKNVLELAAVVLPAIFRGGGVCAPCRAEKNFFFFKLPLFFKMCGKKSPENSGFFVFFSPRSKMICEKHFTSTEDIQGSFYEFELLEAKQDVFRIDKIIRRDYKKKQALVSWKGYSDDFNSWIPIKDLKNI